MILCRYPMARAHLRPRSYATVDPARPSRAYAGDRLRLEAYVVLRYRARILLRRDASYTIIGRQDRAALVLEAA